MEDYYVVGKNGRYGVLNPYGELIVPIGSDVLPNVDAEDIHLNTYIYEEEMGIHLHDPNYRFPLNSDYRICSGEHGGAGDYYIGDMDRNKVYELLMFASYEIQEVDLNYLDGRMGVYFAIQNLEGESGIVGATSLDRYGVFNQKGEMVTELIYEGATPILSQLAAVKKDGFWGYVNEEGEEVIPCEYLPTLIMRFGKQREVALPCIDGKVILKNQDGNYGIVDAQGRELLPFEYEFISFFYDGQFILKKNGEWKVQSVE